MTDSGPDWSALPDRAREFFGLPEDFDATALKRAYTALVRRFKPERHPEEFQRIRAAYERLEGELRYGSPRPAPAVRAMAEFAAAPPQTTTPAELLVKLGADGALRHLRAALVRTPREWCALALLEDELGDGFDRACAVLVDGLQATRGALEVANLLEGFLREAAHSPGCDELLQRLAECADQSGEDAGYPPELYWQLTHRVWNELSRSAAPAELLARVERASKTVGPVARMGELLFKLRLRRKWSLSAPAELLAKLDAELLDELRHLPPWAEPEFDLAQWLARYRGVREAFAQGHPLRAQLDGALEAIVSGDEQRADRALFEALMECRSNLAAVLKAFRYGDARQEADDVALSILDWYVEAWRERRGLAPISSTMRGGDAHDLVRVLVRRGRSSAHGRLRGCLVTCVWVGVVTVFAVVIGLVKDSIEHVGWWTAVGVGGLIVGLGPQLLRRWYRKPSFALKDPMLAEIHADVWRPEIAAFLARTRAPLEELRASAEALEDQTPYLPAWIFAGDAGLQLVALSARFDE